MQTQTGVDSNKNNNSKEGERGEGDRQADKPISTTSEPLQGHFRDIGCRFGGRFGPFCFDRGSAPRSG